MMRPWVYRISCAVMFLGAMFMVRMALHALKEMHNLPLLAAICIPVIVGCNLLAFWIDRKGY